MLALRDERGMPSECWYYGLYVIEFVWSPEGSYVVYSYVVYPLFGEFVYWMCDSYVCVVQRRCNFDVQLVRFRYRSYEFLVMECCMTRDCGAFGLFIVRGVQRVCQR